jgi:hypothetical protein
MNGNISRRRYKKPSFWHFMISFPHNSSIVEKYARSWLSWVALILLVRLSHNEKFVFVRVKDIGL